MGDTEPMLTHYKSDESEGVVREDTHVYLARLMYLHKRLFEEDVLEERMELMECLDWCRKQVEWLDAKHGLMECLKPTREMEEARQQKEESAADVRWENVRWEYLKRLQSVWEQLNLDKIENIIYACGEEAHVFVHALCVKIPTSLPGLDPSRLRQFSSTWEAGILAPVDITKWQVAGGWDGNSLPSRVDSIAPVDNEDKLEKHFEGPLQKMRQRWLGGGRRRAKQVAIDIYFCGVGELLQFNYTDENRWRFGNRDEDNANVGGGGQNGSVEGRQQEKKERRNPGDLDNLRLAVAMMASEVENQLFATPIGYANIENCWYHAFPQFVWQRLMDATFQIILCVEIMPVCHNAHMEERVQWPTRPAIILVAVFGLRGMLLILLEICMLMYQQCWYRVRSFHAGYANSFTLFSLFVEIWSTIFVAFLINDYWQRPSDVHKEIKSTLLYKRPMQLCCLIVFKWIQLMLQLMSLETLLYKLLPAWHAVKSGSSMTLLFYFVLLCLGTALGYYALPAKHIPEGLEGYYTAFSMMFRLDIMGDFEFDELETGGKVEATEGDIVQEMHFALQGFTIICGLVFPVTLLNVYIGLLSEAFNEAKYRLRHFAGCFRAAASFRLLFYRLFWLRVSCCPLLCCLSETRLFQRHADRADDWKNGLWFALPKATVGPLPQLSRGPDFKAWKDPNKSGQLIAHSLSGKWK